VGSTLARAGDPTAAVFSFCVGGGGCFFAFTKVNKPDKFELLFEDKKSGRAVAFLT
jgi:hypothetical protein